jgi:hypothetical protein
MMKRIKIQLLIMLVSACFVGLSATGGSANVPTELTGIWEYSAMTALKAGKPFGSVNFGSGQWTVTFNPDNTWTMEVNLPRNPARHMNGHYVIHGHELDMKLDDGKPYSSYRFSVEQDGKLLVLTNKEHTINANKR